MSGKNGAILESIGNTISIWPVFYSKEVQKEGYR
jgi:hypothetical protein